MSHRLMQLVTYSTCDQGKTRHHCQGPGGSFDTGSVSVHQETCCSGNVGKAFSCLMLWKVRARNACLIW
jgi:hypothetical protein